MWRLSKILSNRSFVVALGKLFASIMLLLITFLAHSFITYINKKLYIRSKRRQSGVTVANDTTDISLLLNSTPANENTFVVDDTIDFRRQEHAESSRCDFAIANTQLDIEPELFTFNESFDVNLLDLHRQQHHTQNITSLNEFSFSSPTNASCASAQFAKLTEQNEELLNNLNKLYKNNLDECSCSSALAAMQSLGMMMTYEANFPETKSSSHDRESTFTFSDDEFIDFDLCESPYDDDIDDEPTQFSNEISMLISNPLNEIAPISRTITTSACFSPKRLSRTLLLTSNIVSIRHPKFNRTFATSAVGHISTSVMSSSLLVPSHYQRLNPNRQRRLRSKLERVNETRNFYSRRNHHIKSSTSSYTVTRRFGNQINAMSSSADYRPSFKVEKLLNDSRGMKKYLIDYDCLVEQQQYQEKLKKDLYSPSSQIRPSSYDSSLINDEEINGRMPYSNRCSSGYISDC